jgi:hypothetical protein
MNNIEELFKTNENLLDNYKNNISTYNSISISKEDDSIINTNNTNLNNESINAHLRKINSILKRENNFRNDNNYFIENNFFDNNKKQINIENIKRKYLNINNNDINTLNNLEKINYDNKMKNYRNKQNSFDMNIIDSYNSNIEPILNEIEKIKQKYLHSKNNQKIIQTENQLKILEEKLNKFKIELFKSIEKTNNNLFFNKKEPQIYQYLFQNRELNKGILNEINTNKVNDQESKKRDKKNINKYPLKESLNNNDTVISFNISEDSEMVNSKNFLVKNSIIQRKEEKEFNFDEVLPIINEANLKTIKEDNNENLIETNENFFIQKENIKNEENEKLNQNLIDNKELKEMSDTKKEVSIIVRNVIETISNKLIENEENDNNSEKDILKLINDNKEKDLIKQPKLIGHNNNKQIPQPKLLSKNNNKIFSKVKNKNISFSEYLNKDKQ